MDILLTLILSIASVVGSILFIKSKWNKIVSTQLTGSIFTRMIGDGSGGIEKIKKFNKDPLQNPDVFNTQGGSPAPKPNRLPDMRGAGNPNGSNVPATQSMAQGAGGMGGGVGATAVVGLVNVVGGVLQNGVNFNTFAAKRQITGAIFQGGSMIYNTKMKGTKLLDQSGSNIINSTNRGRVIMNQRGKTATAISQGRVNITPRGKSSNYIYGNVKRVKMGQGSLHTQGLQIRGLSRVQSMFVKHFTAPKGTKVRLQQFINNDPMGSQFGLNPGMEQIGLNSGRGRRRLHTNKVQGRLNSGAGQYIGINLNDINLQRNTGYQLEQQHFHLNTNKIETMIGLRNVYMDPNNRGLSGQERFKVYTLNRLQESDRLISSGDDRYTAERRNRDYQDLFREVAKLPGLNDERMRNVAIRANQLAERRRLGQELIARNMTNDRMNLNTEDRKALDNLLKDTSGSVYAQFNKFIEENFANDNIHSLSEEEMKEIEQKAKEILKDREDMSLEEKEAEYEKIKEKLEQEKLESNLEAVEEMVKDQVLSNPDGAREILGEEGVKILQKQMDENKKRKEDKYQQILRNNSKKADDEFRDQHPELKTANSYEVHKARMQEVYKKDVYQAANELYPSENDTMSGENKGSVPYINEYKPSRNSIQEYRANIDKGSSQAV